MERRASWTAVLWDFNGTLLDDVSLSVRSVNALLVARGLPALTVSAYREVFGFPISEYNRAIGFDLEAESMETISDQYHVEYMRGLPEMGLHKDVRDTLEAFRDAGARQFVLSAMEEVRLRGAVEALGISPFFEAVYGLGDLLGHSKIDRGRELLRDHRIDPARSLMIGDTDHDAEVAHALGTDIALVAQGHQSADRLRTVTDAVYERLTDLVQGFPAA